MRQLRWGLKAEFPYTKVFVLGILLTVLGSACVIVSVIGIIKLAWGYYVSTGMWGGAFITMSGLAGMYSARSHSSACARLYFLLSVTTCVISFAMLVLSAGGLTYKSDFYRPERFTVERHKVTLFLHGSVLGISVLSLAFNLLSVIVCCKFMTKEKERPESFKLRRQRRRRSDPNSVRRDSSLRGGSGNARSSTNSHTPLFGSERTRKHSRQGSGSDVSTNLKIPIERSSHRRDSDRSRGSSRSRHSHHRQSSSVSQQSRQSGPIEPEVTTALLRDPGQLNSLGGHQDGMSSLAVRDNVRESLSDALTNSISEHLVFDPDEEPPPPYEERRSTGDSIHSTGDDTDTETVVGSSSIVVPSYLPLNIPVTRIGSEVQMESLQRQPPPTGSRSASQHGRDSSAIHSPSMSTELLDNCVSMMRMALAGDTEREEEDECQPQSEERSHSPEICALTGARLTPVAAIQPDTVGNASALMSCVQPSPGSSDTSIPGEIGQLLAGQAPLSSRSQSMPVQSLTSKSPSALPGGIRSPNSAFRPVGKGMMPSSSVPLHNFFSPISAPGSPHHTVYSPVASANSNPRIASNPTSPRHTSSLIASSDPLRGGSTQSSLWKKIPLPTSHNHTNKSSSAPTKEVISKNIPGPAQPVTRDRDKDFQNHSLPRQSFRGEANDSQSMEIRARTQFSSLPTRNTSPKRNPGPQFATIPARNVKEAAPAVASLDRQHVSRRSGDGKSSGRHKSGACNHSKAVDDGFAALAKQTAASSNTRNPPAAVDPVCRSAGIQATDDGGISSSMDRTHRWVLGTTTLPSGTRYQGVTRSIPHTHLTATVGGRPQGIWNHPGPQVESSTLPSRSHATQPSMHESMERSSKPRKDPSYSSPKRSSGPVAPKPIRPNPLETALGSTNSPFSSPAKSQPVAPKAVRPVPVDSPGNTTSLFSSPAKPQPLAPKPVRPVSEDTAGNGPVAFSSPSKLHPLQNEGSGIGAFSTLSKFQPVSVGNGNGAFSTPAKSQPVAPKPVKPGEPPPSGLQINRQINSVGNGAGAFSPLSKPQLQAPQPGSGLGNGTGAFSSPAKAQPLVPKPVRPGDKVGGETGAFSLLVQSQPLAPQPMKPGASVGNGAGGAFSSVAKSQPVISNGSSAFLTPVTTHPLAPTLAENLHMGSGAFSAPAKATEPVTSKPEGKERNGAGGASSAFNSIAAAAPSQPKASKPIPAERSSKSAFASAAGSSSSSGSSLQSAAAAQPQKPLAVSVSPSTMTKSSVLSPGSRLPRYQPSRQNSGEDAAAGLKAFQPVQREERQVPQPQQQQQHRPRPLQPPPQAPPGPPQPQQPQPQQPASQERQVPVIPPRAPPQPQPIQRQIQPQPLQPPHLPVAQNPNQQPDKPLFSVLL